MAVLPVRLLDTSENSVLFSRHTIAPRHELHTTCTGRDRRGHLYQTSDTSRVRKKSGYSTLNYLGNRVTCNTDLSPWGRNEVQEAKGLSSGVWPGKCELATGLQRVA